MLLVLGLTAQCCFQYPGMIVILFLIFRFCGRGTFAHESFPVFHASFPSCVLMEPFLVKWMTWNRYRRFSRALQPPFPDVNWWMGVSGEQSVMEENYWRCTPSMNEIWPSNSDLYKLNSVFIKLAIVTVPKQTKSYCFIVSIVLISKFTSKQLLGN